MPQAKKNKKSREALACEIGINCRRESIFSCYRSRIPHKYIHKFQFAELPAHPLGVLFQFLYIII